MKASDTEMNDQKLLEYKPTDEKKSSFYSFYGLELHRFAIPGGTVKLIGKRDRGTMPHQIYEIEVKRTQGFPPNRAKIFCDGQEIFSMQSRVGFSVFVKMTVGALHRLLKEKDRVRHK